MNYLNIDTLLFKIIKPDNVSGFEIYSYLVEDIKLTLPLIYSFECTTPEDAIGFDKELKMTNITDALLDIKKLYPEIYLMLLDTTEFKNLNKKITLPTDYNADILETGLYSEYFPNYKVKGGIDMNFEFFKNIYSQLIKNCYFIFKLKNKKEYLLKIIDLDGVTGEMRINFGPSLNFSIFYALKIKDTLSHIHMPIERYYSFNGSGSLGNTSMSIQRQLSTYFEMLNCENFEEIAVTTDTKLLEKIYKKFVSFSKTKKTMTDYYYESSFSTNSFHEPVKIERKSENIINDIMDSSQLQKLKNLLKK
jgi:hypothetical protein